ncbi:MAG: sulfurtransferase [Leeuwenhoekiella sp.]
MKNLVTAVWLHKHLKDENLVILDTSLPVTAEGIKTNTDEKTIPNARYFDLKGCFSDKNGLYPNTLPKPEQFELECRKLGIHNQSKIVVFDSLGIYSSPRVWWMFKVMGHRAVAVLGGGLPEWKHKGFHVENRKIATWEMGEFSASFKKKFLISYKEVLHNIDAQNFTIVDARSPGRFNGTEEEPRKHLKSGSIPNSVNIPHQEVLHNGNYKTKLELEALFENVCDKDATLVFSCGSGITACIVMLASQLAFNKSKRIYDGSWTEWAELQNLRDGVI